MKEMAGKREYFYENETGDAQITVYELFPGIEAAYISIHMADFDFAEIENEFRKNYVGFHYCKEGHIEQEIDNEFFYLMPGDCSVVIRDKHVKRFRLPMRHYHGISIGVNMEIAPERFAAYMGKRDFTPVCIAQTLCKDHHAAVLRCVEPLKHIFTESYSVEEALRSEYLKVKLLELLYVLYQLGQSSQFQPSVSIPRAQAELVKRCAAYIAENINTKLNLKELSRCFGVSDTYLQSSFRVIYSMPVMSYIRAQKMQCAAQALIHTQRSVDDIAEEFGYINESKFSAAFRKIMGDTPSTYRKEHSKVKIL